ncbi:MAG: histidinol dehydrogenase [Faecalimonas sp.]|nr:histidinol dehydrogenase [Faecalimonas sp.]
MRILKLDENTKKNLLEDLLRRSPNQYTEYEERVAAILNAVKLQKDQALFDFTKQFDGASIDASTIRVTEDEIREAYEIVDASLLEIIRKAKKNIQEYHEKQRQYSWFDSKPNGSLLGQKVTPLQRVGVYVPGGKAVYPSSVLMNIMPAKVAGVEKIVMVTPPGKDGKVNANTLVAAKEAGADVIYKVGGAQAIGALAYGTESIPKVDKIVGPGNIYVALAKKAVYGHVSIDAIAGPSEILVIADETANPRYVAADLLSQAEHDELASAILVTTSEKLAKEVSEQVDIFVEELSRTEIMRKSLDNYGYILIADTMDAVIDIANEIASEHLEIMTKNPYDVMMKVRNAGAIFVGEYSSEPLGDYFAGPNHVLPTNGTAKFFSPLSVDDFIKKSSIIAYSKEALEEVHKDIESFATAEQLTAHANSIRVRFEK